MGGNDHGALARQALQGCKHRLLGRHVMRGRLIQQKHRRLAQDCRRHRQSTPLYSGHAKRDLTERPLKQCPRSIDTAAKTDIDKISDQAFVSVGATKKEIVSPFR